MNLRTAYSATRDQAHPCGLLHSNARNLSLVLPNAIHKMLTVSELNHTAKQLLEQNIPLLWISGEISNLKCYPSGHWYFSLKDANAQVRCVLFSHKNQYIDWQPKDGMQVELLALVTLYEPRGDFQLNVETLRRAGLGQLFEAFEMLKLKLEKAGLFNLTNKKPIPDFPRQIGVITSPNTAALRDVLVTLHRRQPSLPVIIYPTLVQGKLSAGNIADAIQLANIRAECDVLIICRGGGSIEDLWAFNEEIVALAIAASAIPIICGVGHETDFTIADFVADLRAPTPTGAAELVSRDFRELTRHSYRLHQRIARSALHRIELAMQQIDILSHRLIYPGTRIRRQSLQLDHLNDRFIKNWAHQIEKKQWKLMDITHRLIASSPDTNSKEYIYNQLITRLNSIMSSYFESRRTQLSHFRVQLSQLNPQSVLARGYSITYSAENTIIRDSKQLRRGERIQVKFGHGACEADIAKIDQS